MKLKRLFLSFIGLLLLTSFVAGTGVAATGQAPNNFFPKIVIQKLTNGDDANTPPGPIVMVGDPITWTYIVTNVGNVALTNVVVTDDRLGFICTVDSMPVGASSTCTAHGIATAGQYANVGTATTQFSGFPLTDDDPSHYFGVFPKLVIQKLTNGDDANTPPGPTVTVGGPITWTYIVTNTGNVALTNVQVTDDIEGLICTIGALAVNASSTCTKTGIAQAGQYANMGTTTGVYSTTTVTDTDPSHYYGGVTPGPAIDLRKLTNGEDANTPPGPTVLVGDPITWTYIVTNIGNVALTNVQVTDDKAGFICTIGSLAVSASSTCTKNGVAAAGQYANMGTATGEHNGSTVTDTDPSHYFGADPNILIKKLTNGDDANTPPGPTVTVGGPITWTYIVTNTGNVALTNVQVTDDIEGLICTVGALAVNASSTCTKTGIAQAGQYANMGTTTGVYSTTTVTDTDPSHYYGGVTPGIILKKFTNGQDANTPPGPTITVGSVVTWTYIVTNTGNVALTDVQVTDDIEGLICTVGALPVSASSTCTKNGIAVGGQYANMGTATGVYSGTTVTSTDPSHYFGPLLYKVWMPGVMASAPNFPPPVSLDLTIGYEDKRLGDPKMDFDYNDWVTNIHAQLSLNPDFLLTKLDLDIIPRARGGDYSHAFHIHFPANTFSSNGVATVVIKDQNGVPINTQTMAFTASQLNEIIIFSCTCDVYPQLAGVVNAIEGRPILTAQRTATLSIEFTNPVAFDFAKLDYSYITAHGSGLFFSPHISVFAGGGYEVDAGDERMLVVPETNWQWPEENVWIYKAYTLVTHVRPFLFPANWYLTHNTCVYGDGIVCIDKGP